MMSQNDGDILKMCLIILRNYALTLSLLRSLSYRNQSINLQRKSMDWFVYDRDHCHERVVGLRINSRDEIIFWDNLLPLILPFIGLKNGQTHIEILVVFYSLLNTVLSRSWVFTPQDLIVYLAIFQHYPWKD